VNSICIYQGWGYKHIKDITLSSFFRSLDVLQPKDGDRKDKQEIWNISEKKSYRLPQKSFSEKNTSSGVFLN
jgi:hypothetical protein